MQISFHGAARRVTGSKHLITTENNIRILLDCGMFQGEGEQGNLLNRKFGFDPASLQMVILSHAHIDHTGLLPRLAGQGFDGPIYCNDATFDMCEIMLKDSAHIQESDLTHVNKRRKEKGLAALDPMYTIEDVEKALSLFQIIPQDRWIELAPGVRVMLTGNGHILGSCAINMQLKESTGTVNFTFTGDIGRTADKILQAPDVFPQADYIVCESTYGDRLHEPIPDAEEHLRRIVMQTCVEQQGKIIIPAFSIGRTQEVIYDLDRLAHFGKLPPVKVYVDSPLSVKATTIMSKHRDEYNQDIIEYISRDGDPFCFPNLHYISEVAQSKAINEEDMPSVIISASGMAEAGRIKHHIANNIEDARNTILLVGYASPESLAGRLRNGNPTVRIFGTEFKVKARIEVMDNFSAHGDYNEMLQYLSCQDPAKVKKMFLVHGEYETQLNWRNRLTAKGFRNIEIPQQGETFKLKA